MSMADVIVEYLDSAMEALYEDIRDGKHGCLCDDCEYLRGWTEREPYGEGYAERRLSECEVPHWSECPYIEANIDEALRRWA